MDIVTCLYYILYYWFFHQLLVIMFALLNALSGLNIIDTVNPQPPPPSSSTDQATATTNPSSSSTSSKIPVISTSSSVDSNDYVKIHSCEIGSTLPIQSLDGELFNVYILSADIHNQKVLVKQKILLAILSYEIAEVLRLPHRPGYGQIQNVYQLQALQKLRFRAHPISSVPSVETPTQAIASSILSIFTTPSTDSTTQTTNTESSSSSPTASTTASTFSSSSASPTAMSANILPSASYSPASSSGLLVLQLKSGKLLKYYCQNPLPCVDAIKKKMRKLGMEGHHQKHEVFIKPISSSTDSNEDSDSSVSSSSIRSQRLRPPPEEDSIAIANHYLEQSKQIERKFSIHPSIELIEEMMNLFRLAVEHFANIPNHYYHEKVIYTIQQFLIRDDVVQVLDQQKQQQIKTSSQLSPFPSPGAAVAENTTNSNITPLIVTNSPLSSSSSSFRYASKDVIRHLTDEVIHSPRHILIDNSEIERRLFVPPCLPFNDILQQSTSQDLEDEEVEKLQHEDDDDDSSKSPLAVNKDTDIPVIGEPVEEEDVSKELDQLLVKMDAEFNSLLLSFDESNNTNSNTNHGNLKNAFSSSQIILSPKILAEVEELVHEIQVKELERVLDE